MNKGLLAFNIILLLAIGVLYFLFFTETKKAGDTIINRGGIDSMGGYIPVAYFEMDSIEANFIEFKKMQDSVLKNEQRMYDSVNRMRADFQMQVQKFQEQQSKMSEDDINKSREYFFNRDQEIKGIERELSQEYQKYYMNKQQGIITKIKNYCKEFNKEGKYSYIIAKEPGLFYYSDTAFNITTELVKGLNEYYSKQKKN